MIKNNNKRKYNSIFTHLFLFSVGISCLILVIAAMVWYLNGQYMKHSTSYLSHINDINSLYNYQQKNAELLADIAVEAKSELVSEFDYNLSIINNLLDILGRESNSPEVKMRIRLLPYLEKSLENHKRDIVAWQDKPIVAADSGKNYYRYVDAVDIHNRIMGYIQEILSLTVDHNRQYLEEAEGALNGTTKGFIFVIGLIIIANVLFYCGYTVYLSQPIYKLMKKVGEIGQGHFDVELSKIGGPDELRSLSEGLEKMAVKIKGLNQQIKDNAELEMKFKEEELERVKMAQLLKEAQLQGIQMQINPHFLFNTLNVISKMAILEDANRAYELIIALSKFMRHTLGAVRNSVPLREEVDMISQYLYILKARMGERLTSRIYEESDLSEIQVPLFTLQPIVENAFKHGLEDKEANGYIFVEVKERNSKLILRVFDNGKGMDKTELEALRRRTQITEADFSNNGHIGVENVCYRLNSNFGDKVRYRINSTKGKGTIFTVEITIEGE